MKLFRVVITRWLLLAGVVLLAACQNLGEKGAPAQPDTAQQTQAPASVTPAPGEGQQQAARQVAPVAVFLADMQRQEGWTPVQVQSNTLYVNPQPVITRDDLEGVDAGVNQAGNGLLALILNEGGVKKVHSITSSNPNKRLALVVGRTMLAAPSYAEPITNNQLVFMVGSEQNAVAAAQAISGVDVQSQPQKQ